MSEEPTPTTPTAPGDPVAPGDLVAPATDVRAAAAAETRDLPADPAAAAALADKYDRMMRLAGMLDASGEQMRQWSQLGPEILTDPAVAESATLSRRTWVTAEDEIRQATTGKRGLLTRSIELDADALALRATVLTYRWIDELQVAAYATLGSIAGRAIGYLAPEVALGGAIVSAGLIETDALDRDGVAAYLGELADANPELMDHVTSGGGGLLDGLRMRSLLTAGVLAGDQGRLAGLGGLRAIGVAAFPVGCSEALRDVAAGMVDDEAVAAEATGGGRGAPAGPTGADGPPRDLTALLLALSEADAPVVVRRVAEHRYIAFLAGPDAGPTRRLRLVGGDRSSYAATVVRVVERAVGDDPAARVMLVGAGTGGVTAAEVAAGPASERFVVDQVVTAGSPSAHVPRIPEPTRVLSLEDRSDPVALLGSLINAGVANRVTVVHDGSAETEQGRYVDGARAADAADHPDLRAELDRLAELGYLAG